MSKNIFLNISEVASFIGQNKWDYVTPFERLWKKYDSEYKICLDEYNNKLADKNNELVLIENEKRIIEDDLNSKKITKRQYDKLVKENNSKKDAIENIINKITTNVESITLTQSEKIEKKLGKDIINTIASKSKETSDKRKLTNDVINKLEKDGKIKEEQKQELLKETESFINKTHGTLKEDSAIKIYENQYNVKLDISQQYYKFLINKTNEYSWFIGGKMDGIYRDPDDSDNDYVVEIKNRTKGFFSSLRDYEKTQIQLYLLLTGFKKAKLVEKYNNKIRVTDINIDQNYINDIIEYLQIFISNTSKFWKNTMLKIEYLDMDQAQKQKFLNKLYINDVIKLQKHKEELQIIQTQADEDCLLSELDEF